MEQKVVAKVEEREQEAEEHKEEAMTNWELPPHLEQ